MVTLAKEENQKYQGDVFLYLLPITYCVYLIWDIVKYYEYKKKNQTSKVKRNRISRISITVIYLILFIILAISYYFLPSEMLDHIFIDFKKILFILLSGLIVFLYRYAKYKDSKKVHAKTRFKKRRSNNPNK
jgi:uncharacterized membrane protein YbhN (UPF0104 family)